MTTEQAHHFKCGIWGVNGRMGQYMVGAVEKTADFRVSFGVDRTPDKYTNAFPVWSAAPATAQAVDLLIDFSHPDNLADLLDFALAHSSPLLIATTGLTQDHHTAIARAGRHIPILVTANTSLGVGALVAILPELCKWLGIGFDVEIIEKHHRHKIDAPSGTANLFASTINRAMGGEMSQVHGREGACGPRPPAQIGIHAVRGGGICGEHSIVFAGEHEVIEIRHSALSRELFAHDALQLGRLLLDMPPGVYANEDLRPEKSEVHHNGENDRSV